MTTSLYESGHETALAPDLTVCLLPQRALYWAEEQTLFVADLHLGKADVFHTRGIPIPGGVTGDDLNRLADLLTTTGATRLVILGDLFHARASHSPAVGEALAAWRARFPAEALQVLLVDGNHDRHAGPPAAALAITLCGARAQVGPFTCVHIPPAQAQGLTLCGHVHPVALLHEGGRALKLPCFHKQGNVLTLPAFSIFTDGGRIRSRAGDSVWVIAGSAVVQVA